jgi:hypothetical protein
MTDHANEFDNLISDEKIENILYNHISSIVEKTQIDNNNVIQVIVSLIQKVDSYKKLSGEDKKNIVLKTIKKFCNDNIPNNTDQKVTIILFIDMFLPSIIDMLVSIDKRELVLKLKKGLKGCLPCF